MYNHKRTRKKALGRNKRRALPSLTVLIWCCLPYKNSDLPAQSLKEEGGRKEEIEDSKGGAFYFFWVVGTAYKRPSGLGTREERKRIPLFIYFNLLINKFQVNIIINVLVGIGKCECENFRGLNRFWTLPVLPSLLTMFGFYSLLAFSLRCRARIQLIGKMQLIKIHLAFIGQNSKSKIEPKICLERKLYNLVNFYIPWMLDKNKNKNRTRNRFQRKTL